MFLDIFTVIKYLVDNHIMFNAESSAITITCLSQQTDHPLVPASQM